MPATEMASITKVSYQRLRNEGGFFEDEEGFERYGSSSVKRTRSWCRVRRLGSRRSSRLLRFRLRIPGLRRFLRKKSVRLASAVRGSVRKVVKRLMESRPYLGDIFAGNYMFMQISPAPMKCHLRTYVTHAHAHAHADLHQYAWGATKF
ncbi:hypothetical protein Syun_024315 [Stephania yunnanensis]|uniref:Uncharacterized protein n=1 Tax=Stephania yunnanensis TaxID=152371 RepID=A0AAP0I455_9MAGN